MLSGNHPTTVHLNSRSSSEHCWSVWIHQGRFSFQWEHSSSSSHPNVCIGSVLVNEWQCDEKASIMELCRAAERNDKQNRRLLMQKGIKESWDGLQIILSAITHRAATEIQLCHGAYFKQFWLFFFFFNGLKVLKEENSRYSGQTLKAPWTLHLCEGHIGHCQL